MAAIRSLVQNEMFVNFRYHKTGPEEQKEEMKSDLSTKYWNDLNCRQTFVHSETNTKFSSNTLLNLHHKT